MSQVLIVDNFPDRTKHPFLSRSPLNSDMGCMLKKLALFATFTLVFTHLTLSIRANVGANYGFLGNNLPPAGTAINIMKSERIPQVRLFEPRADVLDALRGSGIKVSLGTRNEDLPSLAGNPAAATNWVRYWIVPRKNNVYFGWVTLGNELVPGGYANYLVPAMNNMRNALIAVGLRYTKVSTSVPLSVLSASYPPSAGTFSSQTASTMSQILSWLASTGNPIFLNCYPYFAYAAQPQQISFEYATFQSKTPVVIDGNFKYYNMFDAMLDAFIVAMQRTGHGNVQVVVSESGWPTAGQAPFTSPNNAKIYNQNMIYHVKNGGTPRRPRTKFDTFIFAMFNENLKPGSIEQNWGIHHHDGQRAYPLYF